MKYYILVHLHSAHTKITKRKLIPSFLHYSKIKLNWNKYQTLEMTERPLGSGPRETERLRRPLSTLDRLRPESTLDELRPTKTSAFRDAERPLEVGGAESLVGLRGGFLGSRESVDQKRGLSLLFKNWFSESRVVVGVVLEKALTLLDLLIGGPAFFVEWESTSALCLPIDDDEAEGVVALLLLLEDLKADTAILSICLSYLVLYAISDI